jgi:hypothetical protein
VTWIVCDIRCLGLRDCAFFTYRTWNCSHREVVMPHGGRVGEKEPRESIVGIVVMATAAFTLGAAAGMVLGSALGAVHGRRVRDTLGRLGRGRQAKPADLERAVREALHGDEATSDLDIEVQVGEPGLVELTGVVSDAVVRRVAADVARAVPGVEVVVNRILLRDPDTPPVSKSDSRPA